MISYMGTVKYTYEKANLTTFTVELQKRCFGGNFSFSKSLTRGAAFKDNGMLISEMSQ